MRTFFRRTGQLLYRVWFYILVAIPIILFSPLLILLSISEKTYPQFFWLARNIWARMILYGMGCIPKITWQENMERGKSYVLVANHTSMIDIMLMLWVSKNPFVFIGKKELMNIPVFGFFYKRVCILVDRGDSKSRMAVYRKAQRRLNQGLSICIFPEGGVPPEEVVLDTFKDGAFKMAIAHKIPIVPMVFYDNKKRFSYTIYSGGPGILRVKVHLFIRTDNVMENRKGELRDRVRALILKDIQEDA
ncbi:1-acyl-sn-glycerol-3-phosphate acyltransferase [uncultured Muriicola sp.]|uniref:lysophospholipid acyltransferase family protein n=1 Tax=uncultured Muriicola sp. TaxID=1583102 RepID=UPI002624CDB9|nr:lysophospholipid acyltransferase family protein [uncultured Muriicola sp.]